MLNVLLKLYNYIIIKSKNNDYFLDEIDIESNIKSNLKINIAEKYYNIPKVDEIFRINNTILWKCYLCKKLIRYNSEIFCCNDYIFCTKTCRSDYFNNLQNK